jgi:hypothetical protein
MPNPTHAFLITIDNSDSRGQVVQLIKGSGSVLDKIEGTDQEDIQGEVIFNRYILKPSLLPVGTPEITARGWCGINVGVPAVVRNEFSNNTAFWRSAEFNGGTFDRTFMQARIRQWAKEEGITHVWVLIPGDSLTGDLLSKFVPIG